MTVGTKPVIVEQVDRYRELLDALRDAVLAQPGNLDAATLKAAAGVDGQVPDALRAFADKVVQNAYKVTDDDIAGLRKAGYTEDQLFELTIAAAYGAGARRLEIAMDAMRQSIRRKREAG